MKINKLFVCALAVVAAGLVGCGGVEGTYKLDKDATKKEMDKEIAKLPADQQEMAKKFSEMDTGMDATLDIKKDGTASLKITMGSENHEEAGTWKKDGDSIVLTPNGKSKSMTCTKSGSSLTCTEKHASGDQVTVFKKS